MWRKRSSSVVSSFSDPIPVQIQCKISKSQPKLSSEKKRPAKPKKIEKQLR